MSRTPTTKPTIGAHRPPMPPKPTNVKPTPTANKPLGPVTRPSPISTLPKPLPKPTPTPQMPGGPLSKGGAKYAEKAEKAMLKGNDAKAAKYQAKAEHKDQKHVAKVEAKGQKFIAKMEKKEQKQVIKGMMRDARAGKDAQVKSALRENFPGMSFK